MAHMTSFTFTTTESRDLVQKFIENQEYLTVEDSYRDLNFGRTEVTISDYWGQSSEQLLKLQSAVLKKFA